MNDATASVLACRGLAETYPGGPQDVVVRLGVPAALAAAEERLLKG